MKVFSLVGNGNVPIHARSFSPLPGYNIPGTSVSFPGGNRGKKGQKRQLQWQQKIQTQWDWKPLKPDFYKATGFHPTACTALCATEIFCYKRWIISAWCGHQTFDSNINKPYVYFAEQFPDFLLPLMSQHTKPLSKPRKEIFYSWVQSPAEFWESLVLLLRCLFSRHELCSASHGKCHKSPAQPTW